MSAVKKKDLLVGMNIWLETVLFFLFHIKRWLKVILFYHREWTLLEDTISTRWTKLLKGTVLKKQLSGFYISSQLAMLWLMVNQHIEQLNLWKILFSWFRPINPIKGTVFVLDVSLQSFGITEKCISIVKLAKQNQKNNNTKTPVENHSVMTSVNHSWKWLS